MSVTAAKASAMIEIVTVTVIDSTNRIILIQSAM